MTYNYRSKFIIFLTYIDIIENFVAYKYNIYAVQVMLNRIITLMLKCMNTRTIRDIACVVKVIIDQII